MKKKISKLGILVIVLLLVQGLNAQNDYSAWKLRKSENTGDITNIEMSGNVQLVVSPSLSNHYEIRSEKEGVYGVEVRQKSTKLIVRNQAGVKTDKKQKTVVLLFLKEKSLQKLNASGVADATFDGKVFDEEVEITAAGATDLKIDAFEGKSLSLDISGATSLTLDKMYCDHLQMKIEGAPDVGIQNIQCRTITSQISGAPKVTLSGKCDTHEVQISGAAELKAAQLQTNSLTVESSGASKSKVSAEHIQQSKSGIATIKVYDSAGERIDDEAEIIHTDIAGDDSVTFRIGKFKVGVFQSADDSVHIDIDGVSVDVDDDGNVSVKRENDEPKFDGHWSGFELGINAYAKSQNELIPTFSKADSYLELNYGKSVVANWNFLEQNLALIPSKKLGLLTGLGLSWNNYRFVKNTRLSGDAGYLQGQIEDGIKVRKSKLTVFSIRLPLIMEFQTNMEDHKRKNDFYISAGLIGSLRINSHSKRYYDELNKEFDVLQYDEQTQDFVKIGTATSPDYPKVKKFDDFYLNPFRLDATARIGWGRVNLFATYALTPMFRKNKGPELYPWSIGIVLTN